VIPLPVDSIFNLLHLFSLFCVRYLVLLSRVARSL
jgi:hypothetical protein